MTKTGEGLRAKYLIDLPLDQYMIPVGRGSAYVRKIKVVARGVEGDDPLYKEPVLLLIPVGRPGQERGEADGKEYWDHAAIVPMGQVPFVQEAMVELMTVFLRKRGEE
jgi:hypothetical protein